MTFNKSSIMTKANALCRVYGMSKSEALRKSWALAKLTNLESAKFALDCKDRWRTIDDYAESGKLAAAILELQKALFPRIITTHSYDTLTTEQRDRMNKTLSELKAIENPTWQDKNRIENIETKLANSIETWTSSSFDTSVYNTDIENNEIITAA